MPALCAFAFSAFHVLCVPYVLVFMTFYATWRSLSFLNLCVYHALCVFAFSAFHAYSRCIGPARCHLRVHLATHRVPCPLGYVGSPSPAWILIVFCLQSLVFESYLHHSAAPPPRVCTGKLMNIRLETRLLPYLKT